MTTVMTSDDSGRIVETKVITLTRNQETVIDLVDADLCDLKWCAHWCILYAGGGKHLAKRRGIGADGKQKAQFLHRVILARMLGRELMPGETVDHIDGNPLNNRRSNLRVASVSENARNRGIPSTNKSGYRGVCRHKETGKWVAQITLNYEKRYLGLFNTPEEAAHVYDAAARELHGEFASLNFSEKGVQREQH